MAVPAIRRRFDGASLSVPITAELFQDAVGDADRLNRSRPKPPKAVKA